LSSGVRSTFSANFPARLTVAADTPCSTTRRSASFELRVRDDPEFATEVQKIKDEAAAKQTAAGTQGKKGGRGKRKTLAQTIAQGFREPETTATFAAAVGTNRAYLEAAAFLAFYTRIHALHAVPLEKGGRGKKGGLSEYAERIGKAKSSRAHHFRLAESQATKGGGYWPVAEQAWSHTTHWAKMAIVKKQKGPKHHDPPTVHRQVAESQPLGAERLPAAFSRPV
jgi:hypothetical protein